MRELLRARRIQIGLRGICSKESGLPEFDTIRGVFVEGDPVYPGSEIYHKTHVQIAVRNQACIQAMFLPL
jgi:hypothetical protein